MFRCVTKELKKKIFNGLDRLDIEMEHKIQLLEVILLYAEGLEQMELSKELNLMIPVIHRSLKTVKSILDKYTLKEIEELHKNNLDIRPTTTLEKVLAAIETYDDFEYVFEKEELLAVLSLYCLGHTIDDIKERLTQLDYRAIQDYIIYVEKILGTDFFEIENLHNLNKGLKNYFKDAYMLMLKQEKSMIESESIIKNYFRDYLPQKVNNTVPTQQDAD